MNDYLVSFAKDVNKKHGEQNPVSVLINSLVNNPELSDLEKFVALKKLIEEKIIEIHSQLLIEFNSKAIPHTTGRTEVYNLGSNRPYEIFLSEYKRTASDKNSFNKAQMDALFLFARMMSLSDKAINALLQAVVKLYIEDGNNVAAKREVLSALEAKVNPAKSAHEKLIKDLERASREFGILEDKLKQVHQEHKDTFAKRYAVEVSPILRGLVKKGFGSEEDLIKRQELKDILPQDKSAVIIQVAQDNISKSHKKIMGELERLRQKSNSGEYLSNAAIEALQEEISRSLDCVNFAGLDTNLSSSRDAAFDAYAREKNDRQSPLETKLLTAEEASLRQQISDTECLLDRAKAEQATQKAKLNTLLNTCNEEIDHNAKNLAKKYGRSKQVELDIILNNPSARSKPEVLKNAVNDAALENWKGAFNKFFGWAFRFSPSKSRVTDIETYIQERDDLCAFESEVKHAKTLLKPETLVLRSREIKGRVTQKKVPSDLRYGTLAGTLKSLGKAGKSIAEKTNTKESLDTRLAEVVKKSNAIKASSEMRMSASAPELGQRR